MILYLWWGWASAQRVFEYIEGVGIGVGRKRTPRELMDLLTDDEVEKAKWRQDESRM